MFPLPSESAGLPGSRSGLYKHYRRLYEGAAATTGYPYLEAEVRYAVTSREGLTSVFEGRSMEVVGGRCSDFGTATHFFMHSNLTSRSLAHDFPSVFFRGLSSFSTKFNER